MNSGPGEGCGAPLRLPELFSVNLHKMLKNLCGHFFACWHWRAIWNEYLIKKGGWRGSSPCTLHGPTLPLWTTGFLPDMGRGRRAAGWLPMTGDLSWKVSPWAPAAPPSVLEEHLELRRQHQEGPCGHEVGSIPGHCPRLWLWTEKDKVLGKQQLFWLLLPDTKTSVHKPQSCKKPTWMRYADGL